MTTGANTDTPVTDASEAVVIPAAQTNASWSQPGGSATNALGNLAAGRKSCPQLVRQCRPRLTSQGRIIASPIVANGIVYVLDPKPR